MQSTYLTDTCLSLSRQGGSDYKDSILLSCDLLAVSQVLINAFSAIYSGNQIDIPEIVRMSKSVICR